MTSTRSIRALFFAFMLTGGLAACSSATTGTGSGGTNGSSGASGTAPNGDAPSRCVGKAAEAYTARDRETCALQGSDYWDSTHLECRGTTFPVSCERGDQSFSSQPDAARKVECLDIIGCGWTEPDGTITKPSGHCAGTKQKCITFATDDACRKQPGCFFYPSNGGCVDFNGTIYLDNVDCSSLNFGPTLSVSVARSQCKRTIGCTWTE